MERIRAFLSYVFSFRRRENCWRFEDYPLRIRKQRTNDTDSEFPAYCAQVINWWTMTGLGETPPAAKEDLRRNFNEYKQNNARFHDPDAKFPSNSPTLALLNPILTSTANLLLMYLDLVRTIPFLYLTNQAFSISLA